MSGVATAIAGAAVIGAVASNKASKRAQEATAQASDVAAQNLKEAQDQARGDLFTLFPSAEQNAQLGFQGALDVFGQSLPAQQQVFQQGIGGAQQALLGGAQQFQNAILGQPVDFSALQPQEFQQPDLSFFQQQLPDFQSIPQAFGVDPAAIPEGQTLGSVLAGQNIGTPNPFGGFGSGGGAGTAQADRRRF